MVELVANLACELAIDAGQVLEYYKRLTRRLDDKTYAQNLCISGIEKLCVVLARIDNLPMHTTRVCMAGKPVRRYINTRKLRLTCAQVFQTCDTLQLPTIF